MGNSLSAEQKAAQTGVNRKPVVSTASPPTLSGWATKEKIRSIANDENRHYSRHIVDGTDSFERIATDTGAEITHMTPREFLRLRGEETDRFKNFAGVKSSTLGLGLSKELCVSMFNEKFTAALKEQTHVEIVGRKDDEAAETYYASKLVSGLDEQGDGGPLVSDILVSYFDVPRLKRVFPNLRIHRFESFEDSIAAHTSMWASHEWSIFVREKMRNNEIISTVGDTTLWEGNPLTTIDAVVVIHVYEPVSSFFGSGPVMQHLGEDCASRLWKGCKKNGRGIWYEQGERLDPGLFPDDVVQQVVVTESSEPLNTLRLPTSVTRDQDDIVKKARCVAECWPYLHACGWVDRSHASIVVVQQESDADPLVDPGTEWKQPLPISPASLAMLIDTYGADTSKLVVRDSKGSKYGSLRVEIWHQHYEKHKEGWNDDLTIEQRCYSSGAQYVVFYCNHSSTSSPAAASNYHSWLRENYPDSRQIVYMLDGGLGGFWSWAKEKNQVDKYFSSTGGY